MTRRHDDLDRRPSVFNECRKLQAVDATWHVYIREERVDLRIDAKHLDSVGRVIGFEYRKSSLYQRLDNIHSQQGLVLDDEDGNPLRTHCPYRPRLDRKLPRIACC
jgi:hypothetical protein